MKSSQVVNVLFFEATDEEKFFQSRLFVPTIWHSHREGQIGTSSQGMCVLDRLSMCHRSSSGNNSMSARLQRAIDMLGSWVVIFFEMSDDEVGE